MAPTVLAESLLVHAFIFGLPVALVASLVLKPVADRPISA